MAHQLVLEVPDEVYQPLLRRAQDTGRPLEAVAADCLAEAVQPRGPSERLRRWAGAIDSGISDLAQRHDEYIGLALYDELKGRPDG
jgi:hypothetical protein